MRMSSTKKVDPRSLMLCVRDIRTPYIELKVAQKSIFHTEFECYYFEKASQN